MRADAITIIRGSQVATEALRLGCPQKAWVEATELSPLPIHANGFSGDESIVV